MRKGMVKYLCPCCSKVFKDTPMGSAFMGKVSICPSCGLRCGEKHRYVADHWILRNLWRGTRFAGSVVAFLAVTAAVLGSTPFSWAGAGLGVLTSTAINGISARRKDRRASAKLHNDMDMQLREMRARQAQQAQPRHLVPIDGQQRRHVLAEVEEEEEEDDGGFLPTMDRPVKTARPRAVGTPPKAFGSSRQGGFSDDGGFLRRKEYFGG